MSYSVSIGYVEVQVIMVEQDYSDIPTEVSVNDSGSNWEMMLGRQAISWSNSPVSSFATAISVGTMVLSLAETTASRRQTGRNLPN